MALTTQTMTREQMKSVALVAVLDAILGRSTDDETGLPRRKVEAATALS